MSRSRVNIRERGVVMGRESAEIFENQRDRDVRPGPQPARREENTAARLRSELPLKVFFLFFTPLRLSINLPPGGQYIQPSVYAAPPTVCFLFISFCVSFRAVFLFSSYAILSAPPSILCTRL